MWCTFNGLNMNMFVEYTFNVFLTAATSRRLNVSICAH